MGFRVWGLGCGVQGLGIASGFSASVFRVPASGFELRSRICRKPGVSVSEQLVAVSPYDSSDVIKPWCTATPIPLIKAPVRFLAGFARPLCATYNQRNASNMRVDGDKVGKGLCCVYVLQSP